MNFAHLCARCNEILALPSTLIFLFVGIFLTFKTGFLQFRGWKRFIHVIKNGPQEKEHNTLKSIGSAQALFTAMSTTIGMGNVVGPSIAIAIGGPGALFWLVFYSFFGSITKFVEVTLAVATRTKTKEGTIIGGPSRYLSLISKKLGTWYALVTIPLFVTWSAIQSNILADILNHESVPREITGFILAVFVFIALLGGAKRVSSWATRLVPIMFVLYVFFASYILFSHSHMLPSILKLVFESAFNSTAAIGGFLGATMFEGLRHGIYKGIYITESGVGTSSIPHALADVENPTDQGLLALYSVAADTLLCIISGLLALVTGAWWQKTVSNTVVYEAFKNFSPKLGQVVLLASITLFVFTTAIGNAFNGYQSFGSLTKYKYLKIYAFFVSIFIVIGAVQDLPLIWNICDLLVAFVAIPNCIGVLMLYFKNKEIFKIKR